MTPNHFPPWPAVYQQTQRWLRAGVFEALVHDLRVLLRLAEGRAPEPAAMILDTQTLQSTPEGGAWARYDGYKRKRGSKLHAAVDTLGHLLALRVTAASEPERAQVGARAAEVLALTGGTVELTWVDQGYTGAEPAAALGRGEELRVEDPVSATRTRFRALASYGRRPALSRVRMSHARTVLGKFITGSKTGSPVGGHGRTKPI